MNPNQYTLLIIVLVIFGGALWYESHYGGIQVNSESGTDAIFEIASSSGKTYFLVTNNGNIGIGTDAPMVTLEVAGPIRLTRESQMGCTAAFAGTISYNPNNQHFWGCDGSVWRQLD